LEDILRRAVEGGRTIIQALGSTAQARSAQWSTEASARRITEAVLACSVRASAPI
jgi:hypothetical protein